MIYGWYIACNIALGSMVLDPTDDKSILVEVMGRGRKAASQYPSQFWHSSMSPYGASSPQCIYYFFTVEYVFYAYENIHNWAKTTLHYFVKHVCHFQRVNIFLDQ